LGELTALPQIPLMDLREPTCKGAEGKAGRLVRWEGEMGMVEGKRRVGYGAKGREPLGVGLHPMFENQKNIFQTALL